MNRRARARSWAALSGFALAAVGCAQILSLDDLGVEGAAGGAGGSTMDAGVDASAGTGGASGNGGHAGLGGAGAAGMSGGGAGGVSGHGGAGEAGNAGAMSGASGQGGASGSAGVAGSSGASGQAGGGASGSSGSSGASSGASGQAGAGGELDAGTDAADAADAADAPSDATDEDAMMPPVGVRPPTRPMGSLAPSGAPSRAFIVRQMFFGSIDPTTGQPDAMAWEKFGYDVDGKCTTLADSESAMPGTCTRPTGASNDTLVDGNDCLDNNFGSEVIRFVAQLAPTTENKINTDIANGGSTLMIVIDDLDDAKDDAYAPGRLFVAAPFDTSDGGMLAWDGTDVRNVDSTSLAGDGGDLTMPKQAFPGGYLAGNTWVTGDFNKTPAEFTLSIDGQKVDLIAETLTFTLQLSDDHKTVLAATLSGAATATNLVNALKPAAYALTDCSMVGADIYLGAIPKWADLASGAPDFLDPTRTCDTISLGAMIVASPVVLPTTIVTPPQQPPACPDAGG